MKKKYAFPWESFYQGQRTEKVSNGPLWDVGTEDSVALDWAEFQPFADLNLPILDVGCGYGKEAVWFAEHFQQVYASDVSMTAVNYARMACDRQGVDFFVSDWSEPEEGRKLRQAYGAMNVYIRAVLHQLKEADRLEAMRNISSCLEGSNAVCFVTEVAPNAQLYFEETTGSFEAIPGPLQSAFQSQLPPLGISVSDIHSLAQTADLHVLKAEPAGLRTNLKYPSGERVIVPATRAILKSRKRLLQNEDQISST